MTFKLDIGDKKSKKTFHLETNSEDFIGRKIGETIPGTFIKEFPNLKDYEFIITGASNKAGFPAFSNVEGIGLKKSLLKYGKGMKKRPKGEGKKYDKPKGLKLRKTIRGNIIAEDIVQINLGVFKQGSKALTDIFKKESSEEKTEQKPEENSV